MNSFEKVLTRTRGIGPGFDFLRIFLAVCIVSVHAWLLTGHRNSLAASPLWFLEASLVPMFFALSGFLITASAMRLSLKNFLINRSLRIVPALAVDVVFCALIVGPIFTTWALSDYFSDNQVKAYFLNVFGYIHYYLPGVFTDNLSQRVNGALWTVSYEILCYIFASFFIVMKWLHSRWKVAALTASILFVGAVLPHLGIYQAAPDSIKRALILLLVGREAQIVQCFLVGVVLYQWRAFIPYSKVIFAACLGACVVAAVFPALGKESASRIVLLPALAYMTVFLGLTAVPIPSYFKKGDYSYGIYLYHDPFLQMTIALFPAIALSGVSGTLFTLATGLFMVLIMSNLSWNFIEKPILAMRKKFSFVAKVRDLGEHEAKPAPVEGLAVEPRRN